MHLEISVMTEYDTYERLVHLISLKKVRDNLSYSRA